MPPARRSPTSRAGRWGRCSPGSSAAARTPTTITTATEPPAIAVVTHDSRTDLELFLEGQLAAAEALAAPLVVVDNASTDGGLELLRELAARRPALRLVEMGRNAGYAAAVNAAFAAVPGRDVLLLNPDVELHGPEPVRELAAALQAHPRVAIAAPRLVGAGGEVHTSARRFPSLAALLGTLPRSEAIGPLRRARERYEQPTRSERDVVVDWVVGAAMMIRRGAFDAVGGWDERYFLYCEDVDFCRRCALAGWEVAYLPRVRLLHRFRRESLAGRRGAGAIRARRRHYASHARLFRGAPRLLLGGGRGAERPPRRAEVRG